MGISSMTNAYVIRIEAIDIILKLRFTAGQLDAETDTTFCSKDGGYIYIYGALLYQNMRKEQEEEETIYLMA